MKCNGLAFNRLILQPFNHSTIQPFNHSTIHHLTIGHHACAVSLTRTRTCVFACTHAACGTKDKCTTPVTDVDIAASVALARTADVAVVNVALTSTEGYDRYNLSLGVMQVKVKE